MCLNLVEIICPFFGNPEVLFLCLFLEHKIKADFYMKNGTFNLLFVF